MRKIYLIALLIIVTNTLEAQEKVNVVEPKMETGSMGQSSGTPIKIPNYEKRKSAVQKLATDSLQVKVASGSKIKKASRVEGDNFNEDSNKKGFPIGFATNSKSKILSDNKIILSEKNSYLMKYLNMNEISEDISITYQTKSSAKIQVFYFNNDNEKVLTKDYQLLSTDSKDFLLPIERKESFARMLIKFTSVNGDLIINNIKY